MQSISIINNKNNFTTAYRNSFVHADWLAWWGFYFLLYFVINCRQKNFDSFFFALLLSELSFACVFYLCCTYLYIISCYCNWCFNLIMILHYMLLFMIYINYFFFFWETGSVEILYFFAVVVWEEWEIYEVSLHFHFFYMWSIHPFFYEGKWNGIRIISINVLLLKTQF